MRPVETSGGCRVYLQRYGSSYVQLALCADCEQQARTGARGGSSGITELPYLKLLEGDFGPRTLTTLPQCFIFIELAHLDHLVLHQGES